MAKINGEKISNIDYFQKDDKWFANVYFNNGKTPIQIPKDDATKYLTALGTRIDDSTLNNQSRLDAMINEKLVSFVPLEEANRRLTSAIVQSDDIKEERFNKRLAKKVALTAGSIALILAMVVGGCHLFKRNKNNSKNSNKSISDYQNMSFDELVAQLPAGAKKDAVVAVQSTLKNFNDILSGSIMRDGEDKRLAHSWDENMAAYLAFNDFTQDELLEIFDSYQIDANDLYEQLNLGNMKEMLYYARATEPSGRADLIKSQEGKDFFNKYENLVLQFNRATTVEDKTVIAQQFYSSLRADFPIQTEDLEGFIHNDKGYPDYAYAMTPMVSAMEIMTRNIGVSLNDDEIKRFNDLAMCNFAQEKFESYQQSLSAAQNVELATKRLIAEEYTDADGRVRITLLPTYEELKEAGIASVEHYDLSEEKNDVGTLPNWWAEVTLNTTDPNVISNGGGQNSVSQSSSYREKVSKSSLTGSLLAEANRQEQAIQDSFAAQNEANRKAAEAAQAQKQAEIDATEKKQAEEEARKNNQWLEDAKKQNSNTTPSTNTTPQEQEAPKRPNVNDVNPNIHIDDEYVGDNGNLGFDGPIYDKDGNIIDNPSAKTR